MLVSDSRGQAPFKELNINNGLPHTDAMCTVQDNKGFLWFATLDGLCRYDGVDMVIYRNDHADSTSLSSNRISGLEYDAERVGLWVATQSGGLNFLDLVTGRFVRLRILNGSQQVNEIVKVKLANKRDLWVSTPEGAYKAVLTSPINTTLKFVKYPMPQQGGVNYISVDSRGGVWAGTPAGLFYKTPKGAKFSVVDAAAPTDINAIIQQDEDQLVIGSSHGLYALNLQTLHLKKLNDLRVSSLLKDTDKIWAGTFEDGLFLLNGAGQVSYKYSFGSSFDEKQGTIRYLFKDKQASIFVSTIGDGIKVISPHSNSFKSFPYNVSATDFARVKRPICFYTDDKRYVLLGLHGSQFSIFDRSKNKFVFIKSSLEGAGAELNYDVSALYKSPDKTLWVGTVSGLAYAENFEYEQAISKPPKLRPLTNFEQSYRINRIIADSQGRIWVATQRGLFCYNSSRQLIFDSNTANKGRSCLSNATVNGILIKEDPKSRSTVLWLGTKQGLSRVVLDKRTLRLSSASHYLAGSNAQNLYSNWISLLHEDPKGNIWAGTIGGGLSKLASYTASAATFSTITTTEGLPTNDVETLLEDSEGSFWIGGIGLTKYDPAKGSFRYFDASDGLQSNAIKIWSAFKTSYGEMIFGGINGFNIFYPQNIDPKISISRPVLTKLIINNIVVKAGSKIEGEQILGKTLEYTSQITLNHKIKNFGLEFASVHSHDFSKIVYKYRLKGFDKSWSYTNSRKRFVNYTGLPSGNYTFELYASGGNGNWGTSLTTLQIEILPPFWNSKYGYAFYALIILGGLFTQRSYALMRISQKHKRELELAKQEQEIRQYEDKMQFFTNVSHELRTPLTLISTPIEQIINDGDAPPPVLHSLNIAHANANRLKKLIDQILDIRKLEIGKLELNSTAVALDDFLNTVFLQFKDIALRSDLTIELQSVTDLLIEIDAFKLEQVLGNLLSNAVKFTPTGGNISLKAAEHEGIVVIEVSNTGSYLSPEEASRVFEPFYQAQQPAAANGTGLGLTISRSLVELHGGTIEVQSIPSSQRQAAITTFRICLPLSTINLPLPLSQRQYLQTEAEEVNLQSIAVIDDNAELRQMLVQEFAKDYKVYQAADGKEGLKIVRKVKPLLVITDVMMPELDGIQLCKLLKGDLATSHIPVLMLTAKGTEQSRLQGLEAQADDYISKPFSLKELRVKVKNTIQQRENYRTKVSNEAALQPATLSFDSRDQKLLKDVISAIEQNMENADFSVEELCQTVAMSRPGLYRKIKELTGMSIQLFILDLRLKRAAQLLLTKGFSVSEVMYKTGFVSPSYFNKAFKNKFGHNPKAYAGNSTAPIN
jgi:signal transduction histidine kinase/ligand-binding sensor domain-containing protein/DNA-binding response OmpR family regulator